MKILLVEDDTRQLALIAQLLEGEGFAVRGFPCADQALGALCPRSFDAVVTDYHLRGRRGCEIVRAATRIGLPSILITGAADREEIARSVNLGARFVLVKPYAPEELADLIRQAVKESGVRGRVKAVIKKTGGTQGSACVFTLLFGLLLSGFLVLVDHCLDEHERLANAVDWELLQAFLEFCV